GSFSHYGWTPFLLATDIFLAWLAPLVPIRSGWTGIASGLWAIHWEESAIGSSPPSGPLFARNRKMRPESVHSKPDRGNSKPKTQVLPHKGQERSHNRERNPVPLFPHRNVLDP